MKKIFTLYCLVFPVVLIGQTIQTNTDTLDFGTLYYGYDVSDTLFIEVTNAGSQDLLISGVIATPPIFTAFPAYAGIDPGESEVFTVVFTPTTVSGYTGVLTFVSNDPVTPQLQVSLLGQFLVPPEISVTPQSLTAVLFSGKSCTQIVNIFNSGGSNLTFSISPGEGSSNYALDFDGLDDYVVVASDISLELDNTFTIEAWGYLESFTSSGMDHVPVIWRGNYIGWGNDYNFRIAIRSDGTVTPAVGAVNGNEYLCDGGIIMTDQWYHFAFVSTGDSLYNYLNGELITNSNAYPPFSIEGYNTYLGWANPAGINVYMEGLIDEVRIWNISKSQQEIQEDMASEIFGSEPGLVSYWNFNEGTGNIVNDKTTNENNGLLMNGVTWVPSTAPVDPGWLTVIPSTGVIPSGSCQQVQVTIDASFMTGGDYSMNIVICSNDPATPELLIPVTLHVVDAPSIFTEQDTLDFSEVFIGYEDSLEVTLENTGSMDLLVFNAETEPEEYTVSPTFASMDPGESETFTVTFLPQEIESYPGTLTFTSNDPLIEEYIVILEGSGVEPPVIAVTPDSLVVEIMEGEVKNEPFIINNGGGSNLYFTITPGEGGQNYALAFDGNDDHVNVGDNINLAYSSMTLEAWATAKDGPGNGSHMIWGQGNNGYWNECLHVGYRDNDVFTFAFYCNDLDTPNSYTDTLWHHWACTFDASTNERTIYRDGIEVASDIASGNYFGSGIFFLGEAGWGSGSPFMGCIDDVRIWNIARPQEEIQQDMSHKLLGNEPGLVAYWNFDEGTGSFVYDKSPNSNNGELMNGVTWTSETAPMSAAWLSVNQQSGTIPAGSNLEVEAILNASEMEPGDFYANLEISSNDPEHSLVSIPVHMIVSPVTGITSPSERNESFYIYIYPNPASAAITIETSTPGQLSILNLNGQSLITRQVKEAKTVVDIGRLPCGVYVVKVVGEKGVQVGKVVKQ